MENNHNPDLDQAMQELKNETLPTQDQTSEQPKNNTEGKEFPDPAFKATEQEPEGRPVQQEGIFKTNSPNLGI